MRFWTCEKSGAEEWQDKQETNVTLSCEQRVRSWEFFPWQHPMQQLEMMRLDNFLHNKVGRRRSSAEPTNPRHLFKPKTAYHSPFFSDEYVFHRAFRRLPYCEPTHQLDVFAGDLSSFGVRRGGGRTVGGHTSVAVAARDPNRCTTSRLLLLHVLSTVAGTDGYASRHATTTFWEHASGSSRDDLSHRHVLRDSRSYGTQFLRTLIPTSLGSTARMQTSRSF